MLFPIDDFAVGVMGVFGAEGGPADEAFEHDCAYGPPVAAEGVACAGEDLGGDVVGGSHGGVGEDTAGFAPSVDLGAVADGEIDLVEGDGLAVFALLFVGAAFEEFLVVGVVVLFVETG